MSRTYGNYTYAHLSDHQLAKLEEYRRPSIVDGLKFPQEDST